MKYSDNNYNTNQNYLPTNGGGAILSPILVRKQERLMQSEANLDNARAILTRQALNNCGVLVEIAEDITFNNPTAEPYLKEILHSYAYTCMRTIENFGRR